MKSRYTPVRLVSMPNWFDVDKEGLAKLLEARGKAFVIYELVQNAWDTSAKQVEIHLEKVPNSPKAKLRVLDDDPNGFQNFSDAYTLYAESTKKNDPTKRGIFGEGEIMCLAVCYEATIGTTTGTVRFDKTGRHTSRAKTKKGSYFQGTLRMNQEEFDECLAAVRALVPPPGVKTYFNGELLQAREPVATFTATLPTTVGDEEGYIRPTRRQTEVRVYECYEDEEPHVYEIGIPVVETEGCKWHIDVQQRVPLNRDRNNVTPAYRRKLQTLVVNHLYEDIEEEESGEAWIREATADSEIDQEAFEVIMEKRHGDKAVIFDPSDIEGSHRATSQGYNVVGGRGLSRGEHENNRRWGTILPAGQVTPSPRPFHPDGDPLKTLDENKWTDAHRRVVKFAKDVAREVLDCNLHVTIANDIGWPFGGCYRRGELTINQGRLGKKFFDQIDDRLMRFLIHEFAHHYESDHLSEEYHKACCKVGARLAQLALDNPMLFK